MENKVNNIVLVPINKIIPNDKNNNKHTKEQKERAKKIFSETGFRKPLTISNRSGKLIAGHLRLEVAKELGFKELPCMFQDFKDEAEEYAHMTADNALASWSELDLSMVNSSVLDLGPDFDIDMLGIKDFVIEPIEKFEPQSDEDAVPEVVHPITRKGDLWILGKHRLLCGDSTMIDDVEKLMNGEKADMVFTDPPYGMAYQLNTTKKKIDKIIGDSEDFDFASLWDILFNIPVKYICTRFDKYVDWQNQASEKVKNVIIWKKSNMGAGDLKNYGYQHEFIMYWGSSIDGKRDTNIWEEGNTPKREYVNHPTQKPVSLVERAIRNHKINSVIDFFTGSGTTLIACENVGRKFFGMELDEKYCDVIINRWQNYTGKKATLESTGQTYEELKVDRDGSTK